jgi:GT2 family glycosyltransferase/glycosyltransferase involved in cell wall biosynthesis
MPPQSLFDRLGRKSPTGRALAAQAAQRLAGAESPVVSIIIPVFNKWAVTRRCLASLFACDPDVAIQIVVVDDASRDETLRRLSALPGVDVVRNGVNSGFVHACNRGASIARGRYLWFLNNDTEVQAGSLKALIERADSDPTIGIVGAKLVYPDGRLQEAGGIIWSDAGGWNYGRNDDPRRPEYNFARDVDYVSGASLVIGTELFRAIGGFDARYAPAYYEDTDLCFEVRARGYRVVYEPRSVVTHYEGATAGSEVTSSGMKRFQETNRPKFREKWRYVLERDHAAPNSDGVRSAARMRMPAARGVLIVDSYVPMYDRESGSQRLRRLVDGFVAAGLRVVFLPDNLAPLQPYTTELEARGVEVLYYTEGDPRRWKEFLADALPTVDVAWICRPDLCRKYLPEIRGRSDIPIVYDTVDLHHLRLRRQMTFDGSVDEQTWRSVEALELACAAAADATVVVSAAEAEIIQAAGVGPVAVVSNIHDSAERARPFSSTSGVLFIGGYNHTPNVDAVTWLVREIMPLVWRVLPEVRVTLLGAEPPPDVLGLTSEAVTVTGYVRDVDPYFRAARVFVAPLRYGAGVKGKIGQALSYGLPTVMTSIGAEGFALRDRSDALIADDAEAFADAVIELYRDEVLWNRIALGSAAALEAFGSGRVVRSALDVIDRISASRSVMRSS